MKKRDHSDPSTGPLRRLGSASLSVLVAGLLGFVLLVSTISGRTSFAITQSGWQIIDPIEAYHDGHGVYPTTLDELEMARRPNFPASRIRYQRGDGGQWFALTVTADNVEQYDSRTQSWSRIH